MLKESRVTLMHWMILFAVAVVLIWAFGLHFSRYLVFYCCQLFFVTQPKGHLRKLFDTKLFLEIWYFFQFNFIYVSTILPIQILDYFVELGSKCVSDINCTFTNLLVFVGKLAMPSSDSKKSKWNCIDQLCIKMQVK